MTNVNLIINHLLQEAETVSFLREEGGTLYFDMNEGGEYGLQYIVKAAPFYNDNEIVSGYELSFKEEDQDFFKGSGIVRL